MSNPQRGTSAEVYVEDIVTRSVLDTVADKEMWPTGPVWYEMQWGLWP